MENIIKCPYCKKNIELTEALTHEISEGIKVETEKELRQIIESELEYRIKNKENETQELISKNKKMMEDQLELEKVNRILKNKDHERELQTQKLIHDVEDNTRIETLRKASEEYRLKELETIKKLQDALKTNEELKRKLEQGSQQTQGEVLELNLEETLRNTFPQDEIKSVEKGIKGADFRQIVKTPRGTICGTILWESKRTKNWTESWISKLKDDLRSEKANIPALVSQVLPENARPGIGLVNGVWVCSYSLFIPLALLLRKNLIEVAFQKAVQANSVKKAEVLYSYITSHEFSQQVEALVEAYKEMNEQIFKERISFEKSWKQREMQLNRMLMSTANIYGGIQGIAGSNMPQIRGLELERENDSSPERKNRPKLL